MAGGGKEAMVHFILEETAGRKKTVHMLHFTNVRKRKCPLNLALPFDCHKMGNATTPTRGIQK